MATKAQIKPPKGLKSPRRLKWVERATKNDDELAALDEGNPMAIVVDWKETPVLLYGLAHLIAQHVRPAEFPPLDSMSYGMLRDETAALIRDFIDGINLLKAYDPRFEVVWYDTGGDEYAVELRRPDGWERMPRPEGWEPD